MSAPVFKRVAEAALRHVGIPPTVNPLPPVLVASRQDEYSGAKPTPAAAVLQPSTSVARDGLMPDLRGLSGREALRIAAQLGLSARLRGSGVVADQQPAPGTTLERGLNCEIVLRRQAVLPAADNPRGATP